MKRDEKHRIPLRLIFLLIAGSFLLPSCQAFLEDYSLTPIRGAQPEGTTERYTGSVSG